MMVNTTIKFKPSNSLPILLLMLSALVNGCSQSSISLQDDLDTLKQNDEKISKQLADIQKTLKSLKPVRRNQPKPFKPQDIVIKNIQFLGKANAPITLIEFTDYHCPFCRRHANNTAPSIIKNYVDTGKIRYGISELPLVSLHPQAPKLAMAVICSGKQKKYWVMRDLFFKKKVTDVIASAKTAKLNMKKFNKCMADRTTEQQVKASVLMAGKLGIQGTPGFILGKTNSKKPTILHAEKFLRGALPYTNFKVVFDRLLKEK